MCEMRISSLLGKITILVVICCCCLSAQAKYGGGTGEPEDPYLIFDANQMNAIGADSNDWDKCFRLMADIDLAGFTGTSFNIIGERYYDSGWVINPFTGVFDGSDHTITNFTYTSTGTHLIGLFGYVDGGEVKNLGLIAPYVDAGTGDNVGSLVSWLWDGTITNCYAEGGNVAGDDDVGGLVGRNYYGTISNCYSEGNVSGNEHVGGLAGYNWEGTITNCYSTGSVSGDRRVGGLLGHNGYLGTITNCHAIGSVSGDDYVGGLCGINDGGTISNCYSAGRVTGEFYVGGLVGFNHVSCPPGFCSGGMISNCYATSSVSGYLGVGGLAGYNWEGTITNCYSTGSVLGATRVGGLVGWNDYREVIASFWDIETSGQASSDGGTGKTTVQMQTASTFAGWGCGSIWTIDEGKDYPRLWWQNMPGEIISKPYYGGGNGEPNDPYLIYTAEQLNTIGLAPCDWDKHFRLMADIDLGDYTGTSYNIIRSFSGVFDGSGHTISNFTYISNETSSVGVFGHVDGGEIENLGLIDPNVDAGTGRYVGSLVSYLRNGTITNCYVEGGSVSGVDYVGGLVGVNVGGTITNSYSTGSVWGDQYVGGLVGYNSYGTITNCYSTGKVVGATDVGGLVGEKRGNVAASFWDIETSGRTTSAGGTGLPTAEMQMQNTFTDAGWDFVGETVNGIEDIWFIPQQDYPHLWWEGMGVSMKLTPRTLNCRSKGDWVKAHLTLPQGFTIADVNSDRPAVLHSFGFESAPLYVFVNENELVQIEAAFEREVVCSLAGDWPQELTVAGFLADGNIFLGTSTVRIITPGLKDVAELALYWLNADCVHPTWCDRIDMNRDSLVNLLDYALLMNIEVEFVTDE